MIRLIVAGPDALTRALVMTVLQDIADIRVETWDGHQAMSSQPPDGIILHDSNDATNFEWLDDHLSAVKHRWPSKKIIVLTPHFQSIGLCRSRGVGGCVATSIDVEGLVAVITVVQAGYVVYPDDMPGAIEPRSGDHDRHHPRQIGAGESNGSRLKTPT